MSRGVQGEIAEPEEQVDVVPGVVQQSRAQFRPVPLLIDDSYEEQPVGRHLETDRGVVIVLLQEQSAGVARAEAETVVPVHGHEGVQLQERRSVEVGLAVMLLVILTLDVLRRPLNHCQQSGQNCNKRGKRPAV